MGNKTSTGERQSMSIVAIEKETGKKISKQVIEEAIKNTLKFEISLEIERDPEEEKAKAKNNPEILKVHTVLCTEYIEKMKKVLEEFKEKIALQYLRPLQHAIVEIKKRQKNTLWAIGKVS